MPCPGSSERPQRLAWPGSAESACRPASATRSGSNTPREEARSRCSSAGRPWAEWMGLDWTRTKVAQLRYDETTETWALLPRQPERALAPLLGRRPTPTAPGQRSPGAGHPEVELLGERPSGPGAGRLRLHRAGVRVRLRRGDLGAATWCCVHAGAGLASPSSRTTRRSSAPRSRIRPRSPRWSRTRIACFLTRSARVRRLLRGRPDPRLRALACRVARAVRVTCYLVTT